MEKQKPPMKGKRDMPKKANRQELGRFNIDGSLDKCLRVNKTTSKSSSKETNDGTSDRGTVNRNSQEDTVKEKATPQEKEVPIKKDGTDRNTLESRSQRNTVKEKATSGMRENGIPRKEDGTPGMCSKVNKTTSASSPSSYTDRSSSGESIGPLKSDSTPDEKCAAVNKAAYSSQRSSESSGDSSGSSSYVSVGCSSLVTSACKSDNQPGTYTCKRTRCKTCPYISNKVNISGRNGSVEVTDHFTCISKGVIYCITCTQCEKIYIGETERRLADRFREHLRDAEINGSTSVARHFNLPDHSHHNMTVCGVSLHHGNTESRRWLERKLILQLGALQPMGINERLPFSFRSYECIGRSSGYQAYSSGMSASESSRGGSSCPGPLKKDGTPDMRYAVNKAFYGSQFTSGYQAYIPRMSASGNYRGGSSCPGPLKKDGTPDMRYAVNKAFYGSQFTSGYQAYIPRMSASGNYRGGSSCPGPLKKDGTPDMRYAVNKAFYGSQFTSGYQAYISRMSASGNYSGGSSCPGPLKKDGTPDMRYAVNKAFYGSQMSR